ncbi:MAG: glutamine synthetase family protein [Arenicellales bacterium]
MNISTASEGFASCHGFQSSDRKQAVKELLEIVSAHGVETVRISFADQHGVLRGKVVMAADLESLIESGVSITSTLLLKDTSHTTVFPVWGEDAGFGKGLLTGASDVLMLPDPSTFKILPWAKSTGWLLGDLYFSDGSPLEFCTRGILKRALERLRQRNLDLMCGLEVEFYVYQLTDLHLEHRHSGKPHAPPATRLLSHGYQYLTEQNYDQIEPVMDLIRYHAEALNLPLRSLETEFGPSQFEVTFHPDTALRAADNMTLFRSMVKQVCRREGYHATFMCRPNLENAMGNGWHLHQSVVALDSGCNLFVPDDSEVLSQTGTQWVAGILDHALESCLLSTPTINGYKRYQPFALAPDRVQWGQDNRGAMVRSLCDSGNPNSRIENRVGEPAANPYLYITSQVLSGLDGVEQEKRAPAALERPYQGDAVRLPDSLFQALEAFQSSEFYCRNLGQDFVDYYAHIKRAEWNRFMHTVSDWEHREYFSLF